MSNHTSSKPLAIVVDGDVFIRMDAIGILEDAGFETLEAVNGDQAIVVLERAAGAVELLFTDVQMPGSRDGFALAREVARRWPRIGIMVASGHVKPGLDELPEGATFVGKPFSAQLVYDAPEQGAAAGAPSGRITWLGLPVRLRRTRGIGWTALSPVRGDALTQLHGALRDRRGITLAAGPAASGGTTAGWVLAG